MLVGLTTNMIVKAPVAFSLGARAYALRVMFGIGLMLVSLWLGFGLTMLFLHPGPD